MENATGNLQPDIRGLRGCFGFTVLQLLLPHCDLQSAGGEICRDVLLSDRMENDHIISKTRNLILKTATFHFAEGCSRNVKTTSEPLRLKEASATVVEPVL